MLKVTKIIQVQCTICRSAFVYQEESEVPEVCPACGDGKIMSEQVDTFEEARDKRMNKGKKSTVIKKRFSV